MSVSAMQNTAKLRNSNSHAFDLFETNGTLYSVTDITEGTTFDKDKSKGLSDILKTALALSKVVGKYHNSGYLHLDIKPSNFLVIPETRELVVLFDMDSVTSMDDIKNENVRCVPYSKGWAAPEQMQGQIAKLCPATDFSLLVRFCSKNYLVEMLPLRIPEFLPIGVLKTNFLIMSMKHP